EDGRLTDSKGKVVDFKNTIIIMTSNAGARLITEKQHSSLGFTIESGGNKTENFEKVKELVLKELKNLFKPEFLNRVDDIIVFHNLTREQILVIAGRMLENLKFRLKEIGISMEFTDAAVKAISDAGFDDIYGARPLRRAIQSQMEDVISEKMLAGELKSDCHYVCDYSDKAFTFTAKSE
ncbi:MAG: AAA family ATPase, partial [Oscillospiraceae bacterium]